MFKRCDAPRIWSRFVCWLCSADAVKPTKEPSFCREGRGLLPMHVNTTYATRALCCSVGSGVTTAWDFDSSVPDRAVTGLQPSRAGHVHRHDHVWVAHVRVAWLLAAFLPSAALYHHLGGNAVHPPAEAEGQTRPGEIDCALGLACFDSSCGRANHDVDWACHCVGLSVMLREFATQK